MSAIRVAIIVLVLLARLVPLAISRRGPRRNLV